MNNKITLEDILLFIIFLIVIIFLICGIFSIIKEFNFNIKQQENDRLFIYENSNEYTVFNKCEKIYDRYYCKND